MLEDLIRKHRAAALEAIPDFDTIAARILRKRENARAFGHNNGNGDIGFVMIERVFETRPVRLFAQVSPSIAFNRISVHFGDWDASEQAFVPGRRILSALISEQSLSKLVLNQNRSTYGEVMGLTAEYFGDLALGPYPGDTDVTQGLFENQVADMHRESADRIAEAMQTVSTATGVVPKSLRHDLQIARERVLSAGSIHFALERHHANLEQHRVTLLTEAANAALHAGRIAEKMREAPLLEDHSAAPIPDLDRARLDNPMLNAQLGNHDLEECALIARVVRHALVDCYQAANIMVPANIDGIMGMSPQSTVQGPKSLKDEILRLSDILRSMTNEHVLENKAHPNPWMMTASLSRREGFSGAIHTNGSRMGNSFHVIRFSSAQERISFGKKGTFDVDPVLEIAMTSDDLMTALRGHPLGKMTPCTLERVGNHHPTTREALPTREEVMISAVGSTEITELCARAAECFSQIETMLDAGVKTRKGRDEILRLLQVIAAIDGDLARERVQAARAGARDLEDSVGRKMGVEISEIATLLPATVIAAMLGRPDD